MLRYPARTPGLDQLVPMITMTKWLLICASFLLLVTGVVLARRRRSSGPAPPE
jgi:cytochrome b subunit of formate dehydrogenase